MKRILWLLIFSAAVSVGLNAQSVIELKEKRAELEAAHGEAQAAADALAAEMAAIDSEMEILSGWQKGILGSVGFNLGSQSNWAGSANPNSSNATLGIGLNAFANSIRENDFWRNKGILTLGWQQVDPNTDDDGVGTGFDLNTDLLNLSSLYGKNISDTWALSGLGELNTSVGNFLDPGTLDLGVGLTWNPSDALVVVIHPLNYHVAFSSVDGVETIGSLGAKVRADYTHQFPGGVGWSSTLSTFIPYVSEDPTLFNYSWLNNLTYVIKGGIGVNFGFGLRNAERESPDLQTYYNIGLSYAL
jgi:Protein of unknown function (DUF3078).